MGSNKEYTTVKKIFRVWDGEEMRYEGNSEVIRLGEEFVEYDNCKIMQWVGKVDIHKKRIFESDIIKFQDPSSHEKLIYGQVVYNHDYCQFEVRNLKRWTYHDKSFSYNDHEFCRIHNMEVVGNIYETPNMLIEHDDIPNEKKLKK